ncbi:MAG: S1 RNA-binding domain-containing protein [Myxococcales bacterium]|nr:S1 RNA-binding domain-containing protein [Myxococcales bacterium]MCB9643556.1 S1 RNA-binding domain-containing protein [Myxococcales bacterium]
MVGQSFFQQLPDALQALPPSLLESAEHLGNQAASALLSNKEAAKQPAALLRMLLSAARRWELQQRSQQESIAQDIPSPLRSRLQTHAHLGLIERAQRYLATCSETATEETWGAIFDLWDACLKIAWRDANLAVEAKDCDHPRLSHFADLVGQQGTCSEIPAHRWLAIRRGQQEQVLQLRFKWPEASLVEQVQLYRPTLKAPDHRQDESILQELVTDALPNALEQRLQEQAQEHSALQAQKELHRLLTASPLLQAPLASISLSREDRPIGLIVVDGQGQLIHKETFPPNPQTPQRIKLLLQGIAPAAIALPVRAPANQRLQEIASALHPLAPCHRVREAGLSTARQPWMEGAHPLSRELANARAQAERLQDPFKAWSRLDPLQLGLAEYPEQLDTSLLQQALLDEKQLAKHALTYDTAEAETTTQAGFSLQSTLNPFVRTLEDLRPGMTLQGVISHTTDFGAFVQLGLPEEGMIHISELADRFVKHPNEIVQSGQHLRVRVLSVEPEKGRISLSLRTPRPNAPKPVQQRKADSLKKLEQLFKK